MAAKDFSFPEAVRKRPGMYIGDHRDGSGLLHMALEIVGNAIDQHRAGWARRLDVRLSEDWIEVEDDGRGFAIEPHLGGASFVERAITLFHDGPTLDVHFPHVHVTDGGGIGIAPVAALSRRFEVDSFRDGRAWHIAFAEGRLVVPLEDRGPTSRSGTRVRFLPDPTCLTATRVDRARLEERLTALGYLHPHLSIHLDDRELPGRGGLARWVEVLAGQLDDGVVLTGDAMRGDAIARVALGWAKGPGQVRTFVSAQATVAGGTHERGMTTGLRAAIASLVPGLPRPALARASDGLVAVLDVSLDHPKFGAPTRDRLDSPIGRTVARAATLAAFAHLPPDLRTRVSALLTRRLGNAA